MNCYRLLKGFRPTVLKSLNPYLELTKQHSVKVTLSAVNAGQTTQVRHYGRNNRAPRKPYINLPTFEYSGDLSGLDESVDRSEPCPGYEETGNSTDEVFKKIFSLEFNSRSKLVERLLDDVVKEIQDHPYDIRSMEVEVAKMTVIIKNQKKHCEVYKHDKFSIRSLRRRIEERSIILDKLRLLDNEKFQWLVKRLDIKFSGIAKYEKPVPLAQREADKIAAQDAATVLVQQKSEAFQKKLVQERARFDNYKAEELRKIELELKEIGIDKMENLADTLTSLGREDLIPKQIKIPTEKELINQKRLEVLIKIKEGKDEDILAKHNFLSPKLMPSMPDSYFY